MSKILNGDLINFYECIKRVDVVKNVKLGVIPNHQAWLNLVNEIYSEVLKDE